MILVWCCVVLLCTIHVVSAQEHDSSRVPFRISFAEDIGDTSVYRTILNELFSVDENGNVDTTRMSLVFDYLNKSSLISNIELLQEPGSDIHDAVVTPAWLLRDIHAKHIFPLFESDIDAALSIRSGMFVSDSLLELQGTRVRKSLLNYGFIAPRCNVRAEYFQEEGECIVTVTRTGKDRFMRVKELSFTGNHGMTSFRLYMIMSGWRYRFLFFPGARFVNEDLVTDVRKVRHRYWEKRYPEATVHDSLVVDSLREEISIHIIVNEGPRYRVKIADRGPFTKQKIRKTLSFTTKGNRKDFALQKAVATLEKEIKSRGYEDGRVLWKDTLWEKRGRKQRTITLDIQEGKRIGIEGIRFVGLESFSQKDLQKLMLMKAYNGKIRRNGEGSYVAKAFQEDCIAIENYYYQQGFLTTQVSGERLDGTTEDFCSLKVNITEGKRTMVHSVQLMGIPDNRSEKYLLDTISVQQGQWYNPDAPLNDRILIINTLAELGYLRTTVNVKEQFNEDSTEVSLLFDATAGRRIVFGEKYYFGNFRTRDRLIDRMFKIESGVPFSYQTLYDGIRDLRQIDVFNSVSYELPLHNSPFDTLDLFLNFDEVRSYKLDGSFGYNTKKFLYGRLKLTDRNFLGMNKNLSLEGSISQRDYGITLRYLEPYFISKWLSAGVDIYFNGEELVKDVLWSRVLGNAFNLKYIPKEWLLAQIHTAYELRNIYIDSKFDETKRETIDTAGLSLVDELRHTVTVTPSVIFDFRNSYMRPTKGFRGQLDTKYSHGFNFEEDNFVGGNIDLRQFTSLGSWFTLALRAGGGAISSYSTSDTVAVDHLFRLGGISTVRGYREDKLYTNAENYPIFGYKALYGNIELRINFPSGFELPLFFDGGSLAPTSNSSFKKFRYSYGSGLRYQTPIGPVGIVYGIPTNAESRKGNQTYDRPKLPGVIHFSIGYTF